MDEAKEWSLSIHDICAELSQGVWVRGSIGVARNHGLMLNCYKQGYLPNQNCDNWGLPILKKCPAWVLKTSMTITVAKHYFLGFGPLIELTVQSWHSNCNSKRFSERFQSSHSRRTISESFFHPFLLPFQGSLTVPIPCLRPCGR